MSPPPSTPLAPEFIAFEGQHRLARGSLAEVALRLKAAAEDRPLASFMLFNAHTSEILDLNLRGTPEDMLARLPQAPVVAASAEACANGDVAETHVTATQGDEKTAAKSGPGRPKLGVVAREVTLLPRHWAWLSSQPGGASVALRKLVEQARKNSQSQDQRRLAQEACYKFMSAMAGGLAGFEEAARALFAGDRVRLQAMVALWPQDIQDHLLCLAQAAWPPSDDLNPPELTHA